jgi:broad specificity phosphatase PhoE
VETILQRHEGEEILIVGHRVVNQMLIGVLMDYPQEETLRIQQSNGYYYLVQKNGDPRVFYPMNSEMREGFLSGSPVRMA